MQTFFNRLETILLSDMSLALLGFAALMLLTLWILQNLRPMAPKPAFLTQLRTTLGATAMPPSLFGIGVLIWGALFLFLLAGLATILAELVWGLFDPANPAQKWDFRFLLAQLAGVTAVLGAVVTLPFTLIRLRLTREQTQLSQDVLFNEKINAATTDLYSRYQKTEMRDDGTAHDHWRDDVMRRNAAIDRLEALAIERPEMTPRIARMLEVYLKELTRDYPPEEPPEGASPEELREWARALTVQRTDMEKAAQTLGQLRKIDWPGRDDLFIKLAGINLQAFALSGCDFQKANLVGARLEGADHAGARLEGAHLRWARLEGAHLFGARLDQSTDLTVADLGTAAVKSVDWKDVNVSADQIKSMFGDVTVILPDHISRPPHWPAHKLDWLDFLVEWQKWRDDPDTYTPPPPPENV